MTQYDIKRDKQELPISVLGKVEDKQIMLTHTCAIFYKAKSYTRKI